jgi:hypothetical protein
MTMVVKVREHAAEHFKEFAKDNSLKFSDAFEVMLDLVRSMTPEQRRQLVRQKHYRPKAY